MSPDQEAQQARDDAHRFRVYAWFWRIFLVVFCLVYFIISQEKMIERIMLVVLAALSIQALVATYDSKAEAALSRAAGYENP